MHEVTTHNPTGLGRSQVGLLKCFEASDAVPPPPPHPDPAVPPAAPAAPTAPAAPPPALAQILDFNPYICVMIPRYMANSGILNQAPPNHQGAM